MDTADEEWKNLFKIDPESEKRQIEELKKLKQERNNDKVKSCLEKVRHSAMRGENMVYSILEAIKEYTTVGEICDQLRQVYGEAKTGGFF